MSVATAVRSRTDEARELALRLIEDRPGVQQRDVVARVQEDTELASSTITRMLQRLEREGVLEGRLDGRRKAYARAGEGAPPAPEPAPEQGPRGTRGELVAVVTALFVAAALVAFVLAPNKDDVTGGGSAQSAAPASSPPPPPARSKPVAQPKPKPAPRRPAGRGLASARRTQVAVLSGSPIAGIAAKTGAAIKRKGFKVGTVGNAPGTSRSSVVLYARGDKAAARALARSIGIRATKPADPADQAIAPKAGLIVVVGADRRR